MEYKIRNCRPTWISIMNRLNMNYVITYHLKLWHQPATHTTAHAEGIFDFIQAVVVFPRWLAFLG